MKPLIVIPARGGSKGVPGKNIKPLNGKPLINYTIEVAREVLEDSQIIVSTDDPETKRVAEATGLVVPFLRPAELSTDNSGMSEVLRHALSYAEADGHSADVVILLQPTSPFRTALQIREAMKLYDAALDMVVSVKQTPSNPYYVLFEENSDGFLQKSKTGAFVRRQDCPVVWEFNGAIYVINANVLLKKNLAEFSRIKKYVMDEMTSHDIDTVLDWKLAEILANDAARCT
jgi:CMP-N,N'-diacetyllegionaminic acid synthase